MLKKSILYQTTGAGAALLFACLLWPAPAHAQICESPTTANNDIENLASDIVNDLNDYLTQERSLIDEKLTNTATYEMSNRLWEFDTNIRMGLSALWQNRWLPAMMDMTKQLSAIQVDQQRTLASFADAESLNENMDLKQERQIEAFRRYQPNELVCQVDSLMRTDDPANCPVAEGCGPSKAYRQARAMSAGYAKEDTLRRGNYNVAGNTSVNGTAAQQKETWQEYLDFWCDGNAGDQGCPQPANVATNPNGSTGSVPMLGKHIDLANLLWGDKQTIDMANADNRRIVTAVQRFLVSPAAPDPVPASAVDTPQGQDALLHRRSMDARYNTIFNALSQMISERSSGSKINTQNVRAAAGLPNPDITVPAEGASYREIMEALTRDRFHSPEYIARMVNTPEEVVREQGAINALKMQQMNDLYKRLEEMVFMEAATYSEELDHKRPNREMQSAPLR